MDEKKYLETLTWVKGKGWKLFLWCKKIVLNVWRYLKNNLLFIFMYIIAILLLCVFYVLISDINKEKLKDVNYILALSTLVTSIIALFTLIYTFRTNRKRDRTEQAEREAERTRREQESMKAYWERKSERSDMRGQFHKQQMFMKNQQFESMFFNMMKQLEDIVSKLSVNGKNGREVFHYLYKDVEIRLNSDCFCDIVYNKAREINNENIVVEDKVEMFNKIHPNILRHYNGANLIVEDRVISLNFKSFMDNFGLGGYINLGTIIMFDHYFRYLYRIMRFVDESIFLDGGDKIDIRYNYMGILRATLSPYELVFLFYNGLTYGAEKVKPLIEKYAMLKNLREDLLAHSRRDINLDIYNDIQYGNKDVKHDIERFVTEDMKYKGYNEDMKFDLKYYKSAFEKDISLFTPNDEISNPYKS